MWRNPRLPFSAEELTTNKQTLGCETLQLCNSATQLFLCLLSYVKIDPLAGGDNERKGEQDHYFCGDQKAL